MLCLGILVDSENRTMSVPSEKIKILLTCVLNCMGKDPVQKAITVIVRFTFVHIKVCQTCQNFFELCASMFVMYGRQKFYCFDTLFLWILSGLPLS